MVNLTRIFLIGFLLVSITWIVSVYLYFNLIKEEKEELITKVTEHQIRRDTSLTLYESMRLRERKKNHEKRMKENEIFRRQFVAKLSLPNNLTKYDKELSKLGLIRDEEDRLIRDAGYTRFAFNVLISSQLSYHREIPDTRHKLCRNITYPKKLPKAGIIICFYNEHYHTLLRTLHSIIDRTPANLIEDIVLVDDYSDIKGLHEDLQSYIDLNLPKFVKLFRTSQREGLIRARIFGSRKSNGNVFVFLDSHVEVNVQWLEPLLARVDSNLTIVAIPIIDIINADTFSYNSSPLVRGGFNWGMHFKWINVPKHMLQKNEDFIKPIPTPTMAGGLFAMNSRYFKALGEYDPGMDIWGGENLEISFRVWMCGGRLEIIPCSRVGHVFRQRRPYGSTNGKDTMLFNSLRLVNVWLDKHKNYFYKQYPQANYVNYGDISERRQLRNDLKCNNFLWYLQNVYPEQLSTEFLSDDFAKPPREREEIEMLPWDLRKRNYMTLFQIRLTNTTLCVETAQDIKSKGSLLTLNNCSISKKQVWYETDKNELVLAKLLCLQSESNLPILYKCHEMGGNQEWQHRGTDMTPLYNMATGMCLGARKKEPNGLIIMTLCSDTEYTSWDLIKVSKYKILFDKRLKD